MFIALDWLEALILGIVQGLTEFLPVSSSGHLEIAKHLTGFAYSGEVSLLFTVILHFATALSTIVVFRKDIMQILQGMLTREKADWHFAGKIVVSMIPAVLVGVLLEDIIDQMFSNQLWLVSLALVVTALLLLTADRIRSAGGALNYYQALFTGVAQAIAIIPGISRSGATIATSVLLKVDRPLAARFSFLMVLPLIFGKMAMDLNELDQSMTVDRLPVIIAFVGAFVAGVIACKWMIWIVKKAKLRYFAIYCLIAASVAMALYYAGG